MPRKDEQIMRALTRFALAIAIAAPATASAQSHDLSSYVLFALDEFRSKGLAVASGNLGVNDGLLHAHGPVLAPNSEIAADVVQIDEDSVCDALYANTVMKTGEDCPAPSRVVAPVDAPMLDLAEILDACDFPVPFPACNGDDRRVPHGATLELPGGTYGDVDVAGGGGGGGAGTLRLHAGANYVFCNLRLAPRARFQVVGTGAPRVYVAGNVAFGGATRVEPIELWVNGAHAHFSRQSRVAGRVCAPFARLRLTRGTDLEGTFVARALRTERITAARGVGPTTTTSTSTTTSSTSTSTSTTLAPACVENGILEQGEACDGQQFASASPCGAFTGCAVCAAGCTVDCSACQPSTTTSTTSTSSTSTTTTEPDSSTSTSTSTTSTTTTPPACGNGIVEAPEACDGIGFAAASPCGAFVGCARCTAACAVDCSLCEESGSTTTTVVTTTTSTTVPAVAPEEICGDCLDNDANDLTDFEDPACCAGGQAFATTIRRGRIRTRGVTSFLRLKSVLAQSGLDVDPLRQDVFLQIRRAGGDELLCAMAPAMKFMKMHGALAFWDKKGMITSARGVQDITIRRKKNGQIRFAAFGRRVQFTAADASDLQVTVGFRDASTAEVGNRCSRVVQSFRTGRRGALVVR
jgi:hypothetical protein